MPDRIKVITAVPAENLDLVMKYGVLSMSAMLDNGEVLAAYIRHRGRNITLEQAREEIIRDLNGDRSDGIKGPSVFFTEPDPDRVSDPRHYINRFRTVKVHVDLERLVEDYPDTVIRGVELKPWPQGAEEPEGRQKNLDMQEVATYTGMDPRDLWKDYCHGTEEEPYRYYAADVPHAIIQTPTGHIPPEYIEVEREYFDRLKEQKS